MNALTPEQKKKGWDAEEALRKLLDKEGIAHLPVCDHPHKLSSALKDFFETKRPDVMVLFPYIGFLFVEVKHKRLYEKYSSFLVDAEEAEKYERFRDTFGQEIWYAISNSSDGFETWYWIPAIEAMRNRKKIETKEGPCYAIPVQEFVKTKSFTDFMKTVLRVI